MISLKKNPVSFKAFCLADGIQVVLTSCTGLPGRALLKGLPEWQQEEILLQVSVAKSKRGGKKVQALLTLDILNSVAF